MHVKLVTLLNIPITPQHLIHHNTQHEALCYHLHSSCIYYIYDWTLLNNWSLCLPSFWFCLHLLFKSLYSISFSNSQHFHLPTMAMLNFWSHFTKVFYSTSCSTFCPYALKPKNTLHEPKSRLYNKLSQFLTCSLTISSVRKKYINKSKWLVVLLSLTGPSASILCHTSRPPRQDRPVG